MRISGDRLRMETGAGDWRTLRASQRKRFKMMGLLPHIQAGGGPFIIIPQYQSGDGPVMYNQNLLLSLILSLFVLFIISKAIIEYFNIKKQRNVKFVFNVLFELHMKYKFPCQLRDTLLCLKNGVRAMLGPHLRRPAVLLLLTADDGQETAMEMATRLLQVTFAAMGNHKTEDFVKENLIVDGAYFTGLIDFWEFYNTIRNKIKQHKMVLVYNFQAVHPHAVTVLPSLTHEVFCPQSQALIILLMSLNCYHYHVDKDFSSTRLATASVEQAFGSSLDAGQLDDVLRTITARAALVLPEKRPGMELN